MLRAREGHDRSSGKPYTEKPAWGISTREAAALLRCSESAARIALHKKRVRCRLVSEPGSTQRLFWDRKQVEKLAAARLPIVDGMPDKLVDGEAARHLLRVGRSSLYRYTERGWLKAYRVRLLGAKGTRVRTYYRKDQVMKLRYRLNAMQLREAELARLRAEILSEGRGEEEGGGLLLSGSGRR